METCCKNTINQVKESTPFVKENGTNKEGAYLTFDSTSNGSLFIVWRREKIKNALMHIRSTKPVPGFKYNNNSGKLELIRNLQNDKKLFYSGLCQFIKEARSIKGEVCLLQDMDSQSPIKVDFYYLKENKVVSVKSGSSFFAHNVDAITILPRGSSSLMVKTMNKDKFVYIGNTEGASLSF